MGFDLAREVRPLHVTPPRAIHRFRSLLVKQKRHRDHDSVTVTIAEGFGQPHTTCPYSSGATCGNLDE
jgi:hypothetical protein